MAETITREWRSRFGTPLVYVGGAEFAVNNLAVYSADRPHVIVHGRPEFSPWIDQTDMAKQGLVLVWEENREGRLIDGWRTSFGEIRPEQVLSLPRLNGTGRPEARIYYAFIPPRP
jgi:hypothetical protein